MQSAAKNIISRMCDLVNSVKFKIILLSSTKLTSNLVSVYLSAILYHKIETLQANFFTNQKIFTRRLRSSKDLIKSD